jgi:hypothetical protein
MRVAAAVTAGTEENGTRWKQDIVGTVWQNTRVAPHADSSIWRLEACAPWICRDQVEQPGAAFGRKIENVSRGGPDILPNLPRFTCATTSKWAASARIAR